MYRSLSLYVPVLLAYHGDVTGVTKCKLKLTSVLTSVDALRNLIIEYILRRG